MSWGFIFMNNKLERVSSDTFQECKPRRRRRRRLRKEDEETKKEKKKEEEEEERVKEEDAWKTPEKMPRFYFTKPVTELGLILGLKSMLVSKVNMKCILLFILYCSESDECAWNRMKWMRITVA